MFAEALYIHLKKPSTESGLVTTFLCLNFNYTTVYEESLFPN